MLKKDTLGNATRASLQTAYKCRECLHFKNHAHAAKEKPCADLGIKPFAVAPRCFTPNVTKLAKNSDVFVQVATIFQTFDPDELRILAAVMAQKPKKGWKFGDKVYFLVGRDYISNYLAGFVAGVASSGEIMLVGSPDQKKRGRAFTAYVSAEGLLTADQWKKKRRDLELNHRAFDPNNKIVKRADVKDNYEPPTIDFLPEDLEARAQGRAKRKRSRTDELSFDIV